MILLTGFLGAGKTTLLRALLDSEAGRGTAVVVNEFGEVGLDGATLLDGADAMVALGNGCLCCTTRDGVEATLRRLHADRARGAVPPFQRVVLETSGADDPTPVLQTLLSDRALGREYHLQAVVAVVDAATGATALRDAPEARRQVAVADRLVLTKTDLAPAGAPTAALRALNPHAPLAVAEHGRLDPEFLLAESDLPAPSPLAAEAIGHTAALATFTLWPDGRPPWAALAATLGLLGELRGADLLRVKGLVAVRECRGPLVVNMVRHILHRPVELEAWPDADARSRLVFITQGLPQPAVAALFAAAAALGEGP